MIFLFNSLIVLIRTEMIFEEFESIFYAEIFLFSELSSCILVMRTFFYGLTFEEEESNEILIDDSSIYNFQKFPFGDQQKVMIVYRF